MSALNPSLTNSRYSAFLFDMDGTILNSIAVAERIWGAWASSHGLDVASFLPTIHGARCVDTIAGLALPGVDPEIEALKITEAEICDVDGIIEIAGAADFLRSLPNAKWAIVTSAPRELAIARLKSAGLPLPVVMVTSEDVIHGKPNPECYLLAAKKLGVKPADCLIFEDAAAGIRAGEAAEAELLIVTSTHTHPIATPHPSIVNYKALRATADADGWLRLAERG